MNRLNQLAINDEGFVFDPTNGESFTTNATGLFILQQLKTDKPTDDIANELAEAFEVTLEEAQRDVMDFVDHLRTYKLI